MDFHIAYNACYTLLYRIVQVDLKFPPKPIVSSAAKDLISQVPLFCFAYST